MMQGYTSINNDDELISVTSSSGSDEDPSQSHHLFDRESRERAWNNARKYGKQYCGSFKRFINSRGNVVDLAVAFIMGGAFKAIVNSLVNDIIMPPFGLIAGSNLENWFYVIRHGKTVNVTYSTVEEAQSDGATTENVGLFVLTIIDFVIIAIFLWILVQEMFRVLKPGGFLFIQVWAFEQSKESKRQFEGPQDQLVGWGHEHDRYYHLFKENELEELVKDALEDSTFNIDETFYERGNWGIIIKKLQ
jgi:large conductance mechanosensitive channel